MKLLIFIVLLSFLCEELSSTSAVSADHEMGKKFEEALGEEEFVISIKDIKPKRRQRNNLETLLSVDFTHSGQKFVLLLDRKSQKVITETIDNGITKTEHFQLKNIGPGVVIRSLLLAVNQKHSGARLTLYHDCDKKGTVHIPQTFRQMFDKMKNPELQVFREKRYTMDIDFSGSLESILDKNNCLDEEMQAQQPSANEIAGYRRGDIPVFHDCDDRDSLLAKTLNALIELIKMLRQDIEHQRGEIRYLRELLERCDICGPRPESQTRYTCRSTPPPCFHGVECRDTVEGPQCGRCPRGYVGDGRSCKPGLTCEDHPCFPGVRCYDTVEGFHCGPCPAGYSGDGQRCKPRGTCDQNPCHPGK